MKRELLVLLSAALMIVSVSGCRSRAEKACAAVVERNDKCVIMVARTCREKARASFQKKMRFVPEKLRQQMQQNLPELVSKMCRGLATLASDKASLEKCSENLEQNQAGIARIEECLKKTDCKSYAACIVLF